MSSGTNQERIEQNNLKLAQLKTKADNLPEYQDIEPVYATLDISLNYKIPSSNVQSYMTNCYIGSKWAVFTNSVTTQTTNPTIYIFYEGNSVINFRTSTYMGGTGLPSNVNWILAVLNISDDEIIFGLYASRSTSIYTFKVNRIAKTVNYIGIKNAPLVWCGYTQLGTSSFVTNRCFNNGTGAIRFFEKSNLLHINASTSGWSDASSNLYIFKYDTENNEIITIGDMGVYGMSLSSDFAINCHDNAHMAGYLYRLLYTNGYTTIRRSLRPDDLDVNGVNYSGNKIFKHGNVYELNSDLSIGTLIASNAYNTSNYSIEALNDKFYRYGSKLYSFDEESNTFTELGSGFYWGGSTIYKLVDNYIEVYKFERGSEQIGALYNGIFMPNMNTSFISDANVLSGKIAYNELHQQVLGIMPNNGELNYTPSNISQTIPTGYTSGGTIAAVTSDADNNIIPTNIKKGVEILGVLGTLDESGLPQPEIYMGAEVETSNSNTRTLSVNSVIGSYCYAIIYHRTSIQTFTNGWTKFAEYAQTNGTNSDNITIFYKKATEATETFTVTTSNSGVRLGGVLLSTRYNYFLPNIIYNQSPANQNTNLNVMSQDIVICSSYTITTGYYEDNWSVDFTNTSYPCRETSNNNYSRFNVFVPKETKNANIASYQEPTCSRMIILRLPNNMGEENLVPENIKEGITIFGVTGTYTGPDISL